MTEKIGLTEEQLASWNVLLEKAVKEPGIINKAFSNFHGYSIGNQILALWQCAFSGIEPGPIATYKRWQELGRQVRGGSKAIWLWQPYKGKRKEVDEETGEEKFIHFIYFRLRKRWFVLSQTDGDPYELPDTKDWSLPRALEILNIQQIDFTYMDGNCLGVAKLIDDGQETISINPICESPVRVAVHEIAHNLLGHTREGELADFEHERTPRDQRELEAEGVALIVCDALELPGQEFSRGYIQNWWGLGKEIPEESAKKIFSAANKILRAGRGLEVTGEKVDETESD